MEKVAKTHNEGNKIDSKIQRQDRGREKMDSVTETKRGRWRDNHQYSLNKQLLNERKEVETTCM